MFSQLIKQYIPYSPYKINNFKINVRFLCQIPTKEQQIPEQNITVKDENIEKQKYLGYETIYKYPGIKYMALYNKIKRTMLFGSIVVIPTMYALDQMNILSEASAMIIATLTCSFATSLCVAGILVDNQIGYIYYKDDKNIKIAYVNVWGNRVDIDTSVEDIKSLTSTPPKLIDKLYRTVHLNSHGRPLKLCVKNSIVSDKHQLAHVLGDYE